MDWGTPGQTQRPDVIVSMSPLSYSSAWLRPRRARLRFTQRVQFTVLKSSVPDITAGEEACRRC